MTVLRSLESKIAGLVEGTFSRAFRSEVRPVEIARKLAREMEEHQTHSVSRVYVPNEYVVYLSPDDHERFVGFERELRDELAGYLLEHARRERFALMSRPSIEFRTDDRLRLGEFGIQARLVEPGEEAAGAAGRAEAVQGDVGHTMIYSAAERLQEPLEQRARARNARALLVTDGRRLVVGAAGATIGRSRSCDIVLEDANVSRTHAEIRPRGGAWIVADLGSTNGVAVNGARIEQAHALKPGDRIELGTTVLTFEVE
ncbi:MAG: FHA domain-containing protein [Actinobacteria bacterium]|nr:FHA domain-containing protein [Actinomycetota bacterium]